MLTLIPPQTPGEWLAWTSAVITIVFGLICFFAPRTTYRILRRFEDPALDPPSLEPSRERVLSGPGRYRAEPGPRAAAG